MISTVVKTLLLPRGTADPVVCRVCLKAKENLQPLDLRLEFGFSVDKSSAKSSLQCLLEEVSGCKEISQNSLRGLCDECMDSLMTSINFRRSCLRADCTITLAVELLENLVERAEPVAPATTLLAQVSISALTPHFDMLLKNYESCKTGSNKLQFNNEIFKVEPQLDGFELDCTPISDDWTAKSALQCNVCGKCFQNHSSLKIHSVYHGDRIHQCDVCPKNFKSMHDLNRHLKIHDDDFDRVYKSYKCPYCQKVLISHCGYKYHVATHENAKIKRKNHHSGVCDAFLESSNNLYEHRQSKHIHVKKKYECDYCGKTLGSKYSLIMHLKHHLCTICNRIYPTTTQVKSHYRSVHFMERPCQMQLQCDLCGTILGSKSSLVAHLKTHGPRLKCKDPSKKKLCPICGKLSSNSAIQKHLLSHGERNYPCQICSKKFKTKGNLYNHHQQVHVPPNEKKSYSCDHCGAVRTSKTSIMMHLQLHEPKGSFKCNTCNKVFVRERYLKNHEVTHLNVRREVCNICGNRFINKKALLYHTRLHTGERPYVCELCGERFVSENRKNNHFKCKHTAKSVPCLTCGALFHTQSLVNSHVKKVHLKQRSKNGKKCKVYTNVIRTVKENKIRRVYVRGDGS